MSVWLNCFNSDSETTELGLTDLKNMPEVILAASANTSTASNATGLLESSTDTLPLLTVTLLSAKPIAENVAVVGIDAVKVKLPSAEPIPVSLKEDFDILFGQNNLMLKEMEKFTNPDMSEIKDD